MSATGDGGNVAAVATATVGLFAALALSLGLAVVAAIGGVPSGGDAGASVLAVAQIPQPYLRMYLQAAQRYGVDWAVLAGVGKVECDHGRDPDPSCAREGAVNGAGAGGPMQFIAATWARYGVDGDSDGIADRWNPADAIDGTANLLRAAGAPEDYRRALFAYNHAGWYVTDVERWAARYRASARASPETGDAGQGTADMSLIDESATTVHFIRGDRAELDSEDGNLALIPAGVPASVQAMVVAGNELQRLPYGPGGHPDPRGSSEEDCSSTVNYLLYRSGIRPIDEIVSQNPLAQDYVRWGAPGPGRWVTIYATIRPTAHVFVIVAGLRLDTSHDGTDVGPNRDQDGPRWRVLDHIPTWAHWSVRHPPGL